MLVPHTSALHLAVELDGVKHGDIVSCSNLTFSATVSPAFYESGNQVFIDSEHEMRDMRLFPVCRWARNADLDKLPADYRVLCGDIYADQKYNKI